MAYRIVDHPKAEAELDRLYTDIAVEAGTRIAGTFVDGVITFIESLETFPERGTLRQSAVPGLRIIGYRRSVSVAFSVTGDEVFKHDLLLVTARKERGTKIGIGWADIVV